MCEGVCGWGWKGLPVSEVAGWEVLCQLDEPAFAFPLCLCKLSLGGSSPSFGGMLIFVIGLCPACMPCPPFHRSPGTQIVLERGRMKRGKGQ